MWLLLACTGQPPDSTPIDDTSPEDTSTDTVPLGYAGLDALGVENVIVLHVDTLRADRLPMYGYERDTLPTIGGLPWMVVDGAWAVDSWTLPSTTSVLTALEPGLHGFTHMTADGDSSSHPTVPTLPVVLHDAGFATFLASGNSGLTDRSFLTDGFDALAVREGADADGIDYLSQQAVDWLDTLDPGQPSFVFLQPMDAHGPYRPREHLGTWADLSAIPYDLEASEDEQLRQFQAAYTAATPEDQLAMLTAVSDLYDEDILNIDDGVTRLLGLLEERGRLDDTLIVFTSDHGETLGENEHYVQFGHGGAIRPELTRSPLAFLHPRLEGQRVDCLTMNVDLGPTLLRALGAPAFSDVQGIALQDGCRTVVRTSNFENHQDTNEVRELGVTDGQTFLRWSCAYGDSFAYDLATDPIGVDGSDGSTAPAALQEAMAAFDVELQGQSGTPACGI